MSRSNYSHDYEHLELYRASVDRALNGKRGQKFLRELLAALDALPEKRLISGDLIDGEGAVCALGSVAKKRGVDVADIDTTDRDQLSDVFDIAPSMTAEIMFVNDDDFGYERDATPEQRYKRVRNWVTRKILVELPEPADEEVRRPTP